MRTIQCTSFYPSYCSYGQRLPYYKALHYDEYSIIISCQHIHKRVKETDLLYNDNHPSTLVALTARITKNSIRIVEGISPVLIFPSPIGVAEQKLAASSHDPTPQILRWSKTQDFFEEKPKIHFFQTTFVKEQMAANGRFGNASHALIRDLDMYSDWTLVLSHTMLLGEMQFPNLQYWISRLWNVTNTTLLLSPLPKSYQYGLFIWTKFEQLNQNKKC